MSAEVPKPWWRPIESGTDGALIITSRGLLGEAVGYVMHCVALVWPGMNTPVFSDPVRPNAAPRGDQIDVVTAEALRQYEAQRTDLKELRSRALSMVTVALTEIGLLAATAGTFVQIGGWRLGVWGICFLVVLLGLAGMASTASSSAQFLDVEIREVLRHPGDVRAFYAGELADSLPMGHATVNARITYFRDALALMVVGALLYGVLWVTSFFD
jgi:hypothetical protein